MEGIDAVGSKGKLLGLDDYVLLWPIVVLLKDYFQKEAKETKDAGSQQETLGSSNANKKRKSTNAQE